MTTTNSDLPATWLATTLGQVVNYGATEKVEPEEITPETWVLELEDVERDSSRVLKRVAFAERRSKSTKNRFSPGDVLYGKLRPYLNKVVYADAPGVCTTEIVPIKPGPALIGRYLFHWLRHPEFLRYVTEISHGVNMPRLGTEAGNNAPLVLPPLREQQRIADKLDTVLARVDACRDRLAGVAPLLKRFRQSVLAAATSGRLTEDWRSTRKTLECGANLIKSDAAAKSALLSRDEGLAKKKSSANSEIDDSYTFPLPESWAFTSWGKLSEWITYGFTRPMPATSKGVKLLTAKNVHPFELRTEDCGFTSDIAFSELSEKDKPHLGDLLITKDGTIGRAAVVRSNEPFCINQSVAVCWLRSTTMNRRFLEIVANVDYTQRFVMEKAKGMAIQHLSITDFAQCPVPVPPLAEQDEIVRRVETLFAFADRLGTRLAQAQTAVDRLTPSLLAKAFRGELVPQDPKDEPAIELLRRLQADRPEGKSARRRRAAA